MITYGLSKAATHHLVLSLAAHLPGDASACAILPKTLDTPANRAAMPDAATDDWTPPRAIAERIRGWADGSERRPRSGSLVSVITQQGTTQFKSVVQTIHSNEA